MTGGPRGSWDSKGAPASPAEGPPGGGGLPGGGGGAAVGGGAAAEGAVTLGRGGSVGVRGGWADGWRGGGLVQAPRAERTGAPGVSGHWKGAPASPVKAQAGWGSEPGDAGEPVMAGGPGEEVSST